MPSYEIAHLIESGQNMIIVPLASSFEDKTAAERQSIIAELQTEAFSACLAGTVVAVWDGGGGRMSFSAPDPWEAFFEEIDLEDVAHNLNKTLSW